MSICYVSYVVMEMQSLEELLTYSFKYIDSNLGRQLNDIDASLHVIFHLSL